MNLFESKSIYNSGSSKFIEEFYINGNSVDCDEYYFYLEREKDVEDKKLVENKLKNKEKELVKEKVEDNPYIYNNCDDNCEECKDYINNCKCDECCGECDCNCQEECEVEEFDYGELLEIFTCRAIDAGKDFQLVKTILDEFADIFIPDYDEDEFVIDCENEEEEEEQINECEDCENKQECMEISTIEHFFDKIQNLDCDCDSCVKNVLYELFVLGKDIGWRNHRGYIKELMDEALED